MRTEGLKCPYIGVLQEEQPDIGVEALVQIDVDHIDAKRSGERCPHCERGIGSSLVAEYRERKKSQGAIERLRMARV